MSGPIVTRKAVEDAAAVAVLDMAAGRVVPNPYPPLSDAAELWEQSVAAGQDTLRRIAYLQESAA